MAFVAEGTLKPERGCDFCLVADAVVTHSSVSAALCGAADQGGHKLYRLVAHLGWDSSKRRVFYCCYILFKSGFFSKKNALNKKPF